MVSFSGDDVGWAEQVAPSRAARSIRGSRVVSFIDNCRNLTTETRRHGGIGSEIPILIRVHPRKSAVGFFFAQKLTRACNSRTLPASAGVSPAVPKNVSWTTVLRVLKVKGARLVRLNTLKALSLICMFPPSRSHGNRVVLPNAISMD